MNSIGSKLKKMRSNVSLTQDDVCLDLLYKYNYPITPTTLSLYENDKRQLTVEALVHFADYYNCSTDYLVGRVKYEDELSIDDIKYLLIKRFIRIIDSMEIEGLLHVIDLLNQLSVEDK